MTRVAPPENSPVIPAEHLSKTPPERLPVAPPPYLTMAPPENLPVTPQGNSPVVLPEYSTVTTTENSTMTRTENKTMTTTENGQVPPAEYWPLTPPPPEVLIMTPTENSKATTALIPDLVGLMAVIIIVIVAIWFYCICKRRNVDPPLSTDNTEVGGHQERGSHSTPLPGGYQKQESELNNKRRIHVISSPLVNNHGRHKEGGNDSAAPPNGNGEQQVLVPSRQTPENVPKQAPGKPELNPSSTNDTGETELDNLPAGVNLKSYKYKDLADSTGSFSHANLLGQGGFGEVFRGTLRDGQIAAIKKLKYQVGQKEEEFKAEVKTISRVHHKHLVKLIGYCDEDSNRLLVFEYVPNNSLSSHLHGADKPILSWNNRIKIAIGSAKGLKYLHHDCNPRIIHRDIKADNILLDNNFEPKISDFGLAKDCSFSVTHISTDPRGTRGYLAPEYVKDRKLTDKSDVFSFGVVLLELITGRKSVFFEGKYPHNLAIWMMPQIEKALESGKYDELVDPKLEKKNINKNELARMTSCAAACAYKPASDRPHMNQIVKALEGHLPLERIWNVINDKKFFYESPGKRRNLYGI